LVPDVYAQGLPLQAYTRARTVWLGRTSALLSDSHRVLWVDTTTGLSRFDDREFRSFSEADGLPHPWIHALIEDRAGVNRPFHVDCTDIGAAARPEHDGRASRRTNTEGLQADSAMFLTSLRRIVAVVKETRCSRKRTCAQVSGRRWRLGQNASGTTIDTVNWMAFHPPQEPTAKITT